MCDWIETREIMLEVEQLFQRNDDLQDIQDINKMSSEIEAYYSNNLKDHRSKIKSLTSNLAIKESEISAPTEAEHTSTLKLYLERKDIIQTNLHQLRDDIDAKRDNIIKLVDLILNIKRDMAELSTNINLQDSRTAYAVSLYSKISHINWNYAATTNEKLSGYITNDHKCEIHQFDLNVNDHSSFELTNKLWDVIASSSIE